MNLFSFFDRHRSRRGKKSLFGSMNGFGVHSPQLQRLFPLTPTIPDVFLENHGHDRDELYSKVMIFDASISLSHHTDHSRHCYSVEYHNLSTIIDARKSFDLMHEH